MDSESFKKNLVFYVLGIVPVVWLALLAAPYMHGGLIGIVKGLAEAFEQPFNLHGQENSVKTILIFLAAYALGIGIFYSTRKNYRRGEEHGSARWGDAKTICKKYRDKTFEANKLLTQNVRIGLDGYKHRRNLNTLVCGGSGAGKTLFFAEPNVMQANTSMVILDRSAMNRQRHWTLPSRPRSST